MEEKPEQSEKITRRELFGKAKKAALVVGGLALGAEAAKSIVEDKVELPQGTFYPLLERHDVGIAPEDLPPQLDAFFREGIIAMPLEIAQSGQERAVGITYTATDFSGFLAPDLRQELAKRGVVVALGDINLPQEYYHRKSAVKILVGAIGLSLARLWGERFLSKKEKLSRRVFLKLGAVGGVASALTISTPLLDTLAIALYAEKKTSPQTRALRRIAGRLEALDSALSPDEALGFYRSAYFANALFVLGNVLSRDLKRPPQTAYHVGARHAIVRDFLVAGENFTKLVLLAPDKKFFQELIGVNEGLPENFGGARLFRFEGAEAKLTLPVATLSDEKLVQGVKEKLGS